MKIGYCIVPKIGGTFNFFCNLQAALLPHGWQVFGVSAGRRECDLWQEEFAVEGCVRVGGDVDDPLAAAQALVNWAERNDIRILIPMSSWIAASAVPHLPPTVRTVTRCGSITRHAYNIVTNNCPLVSRVIATSPRQYDDLSTKKGISKEKLAFIPHGLPLEAFSKVASSRRPVGGPVRLGYVGRLENQDKGCLYLPVLADQLERAKVPFVLDIVGSGPDEQMLRRRLRHKLKNGYVRMHGRRTNAEIPSLLSNMDIFVMPSHFEGFGFSLVEAMAAGCVPVASRIPSVTDWIIKEGQTGYVCPTGNMKAFAEAIRQLADDRDTLRLMSESAAGDVAFRFNLERMGRDYDKLFRQVLVEPPSKQGPRPWSEFRLDPAYAPTWRRFVPQAAKNWARRKGFA